MYVRAFWYWFFFFKNSKLISLKGNRDPLIIELHCALYKDTFLDCFVTNYSITNCILFPPGFKTLLHCIYKMGKIDKVVTVQKVSLNFVKSLWKELWTSTTETSLFRSVFYTRQTDAWQSGCHFTLAAYNMLQTFTNKITGYIEIFYQKMSHRSRDVSNFIIIVIYVYYY